MRRAVIVLAAFLLVACEDLATLPVQSADVFFRVDGQTCTGTGSMNFFIDGLIVGTETMSAGGTSRAYRTTRSTHVLGAEIANTRALVWGPINVDLSQLSSYTQILTC